MRKFFGLCLVLLMLQGCREEIRFFILHPSLEELRGDASYSDTTYDQTIYPVVLVHGLYGFKDIFGIDYFYLVTQALELGGANVHIVSVSGLESSEIRGEQLLADVQDILAETGAAKVNLIGHSHGGPTSRYVAAVRPDLVASVTTVHGVNDGGSDAAELITHYMHGMSGLVLQTMFNALGALIDFVAQDFHPQSAIKSFESLSFEGLADFNSLYPQGLPAVHCGEGAYTVSGVNYYSWGGNAIRTNSLDPLDWLMAASGTAFGSQESDGMVEKCDQHLGKVIRDDYAHNHLDAMNWTIGLRQAGSANPLSLYRQQVNRLKLDGF